MKTNITTSKVCIFTQVKKLVLDLQHCYGIKSLTHKFDFAEQNVYAIYAANGLMKSSFAQTFKDYANGVDSKDRVFPKRTCNRSITDETTAPLPQENILVISPYDETFGLNEKTSTLLVDKGLRKEYEDLHKEIEAAKESLLNALKLQSSSKKELEKEISSTFTKSEDEFYKAIIRIKGEIETQKDAPFKAVQYDTIFDDRVITVLNQKDYKTAINDYITRYGELLDKSTYFKKGIFEYYNASTIAKTLADNGFFDAKHTVSLNADEKIEINTQTDLQKIISNEKEAITSDSVLRKKFEDLEKLLDKNIAVREFKSYIINNEYILPYLANLEQFKEDVWKSYFKENLNLYNEVVEKYQGAEKRKQEIEKLAAEQRTDWEKAIDLFNERFFVPFKLTPVNRIPVILGDEPMLTLGFEFSEAEDKATLDKSTLLQVLSQGEKKALYILNIIFEIEVRRKSGQETIFVVDDIADSFDYKNKYAIIQYLQDISNEPNFREIILTHNFDFFRIVNSRFVKYSHCLMAVKGSTGITLEVAQGIKNIFVNDWKKNFYTDDRKKVASIPFIRNIIEYTKPENDPDFLKLTSLLHWKDDTSTITVKDLNEMFSKYFNEIEPAISETRLAIDLIKTEAEKCETSGDEGVNFEHKIILSIAIRLIAEKFMIDRIADKTFIDSIKSNQTQELVKKFIQKFNNETDKIKELQKVALMTPENIHLNSFMYEPILDMSDEHLRKLYRGVKGL